MLFENYTVYILYDLSNHVPATSVTSGTGVNISDVENYLVKLIHLYPLKERQL